MMLPPKLTLQNSKKAGFHLDSFLILIICCLLCNSLSLKCFSVLLLKIRAFYSSVKDFLKHF